MEGEGCWSVKRRGRSGRIVRGGLCRGEGVNLNQSV